MHRALRPTDLVFVKIDVETGEFTLIPHLLQHGALCGVDFFLIEWHFSKLAEAQRLGALGLRLSLAQTLERGCPPRPEHRFIASKTGQPAMAAHRYIQHDEAQLSRHVMMPGLWERVRWHNGNPPLKNGSNMMPWSSPNAIMSQERGGGLE